MDAKLKKQQVEWSSRRGIRIDEKGYTRCLKDNLFREPSEEAYREYRAAAGDELGLRNPPGKMWALHSSSALVCNFFDYWRPLGVGPIAEACGADSSSRKLEFESTFPTGLGGKPPHLDLAIRGAAPLTALECKYLEPYRTKPAKPPFRPVYFERREVWEPIARCLGLARALQRDPQLFELLDAAQLLKHLIGLSTQCPEGFRLLYVWYDVGGREAEIHRKEIKRFRQEIDPHIDFGASTYQELFLKLTPHLAKHATWRDYMQARYFPTLA